MSDSEITFTFDDVPYRVDAASLTMDEWIELEEQGIEFASGKVMSMKVMKGIAWVAIHRDRPEVTFADIGAAPLTKLLQGTEVPDEAAVEEDVNPTSPTSGSELAVS
jgi:hypothetical protein